MALFTDLLTAYRLWLGCVVAVVTLVGLLFVVALNIFRKTIPALFL
jgi:hypothetical protein